MISRIVAGPRWTPTPGVVLITRATPWGNPWCVTTRLAADPETRELIPGRWVHDVTNKDTGHFERTEMTLYAAHDLAVRRYEEQTLAYRLETGQLDLAPLAGVRLACRCPDGMPCHVDTLAEYAVHPEPLQLARQRRSSRAPSYVSATT